MSPDIFKEARRRQAAGHRYIQLIVERKRRPRTSRIRVAPGILGILIGETSNDGHYMVDVLIEDVLHGVVV